MTSPSAVFGLYLTMIWLPRSRNHSPSEMLSKHQILYFAFSPRKCWPRLQSPRTVTHMPTRSFWVTRTGAGVGVAANRITDATRATAMGNETELSHRWRNRAWLRTLMLKLCKASHRSGQRLAVAIG